MDLHSINILYVWLMCFQKDGMTLVAVQPVNSRAPKIAIIYSRIYTRPFIVKHIYYAHVPHSSAGPLWTNGRVHSMEVTLVDHLQMVGLYKIIWRSKGSSSKPPQTPLPMGLITHRSTAFQSWKLFSDQGSTCMNAAVDLWLGSSYSPDPSLACWRDWQPN